MKLRSLTFVFLFISFATFILGVWQLYRLNWKNDLIENINQIEKFLNNGYNDFFSFEPFSEEFINNVDKFNLTQKTFDFILSNLPK